jgi:peptide/nickel transport system substrate-binding protein
MAHVDSRASELIPADHAALARPSHAVTIRTVHDENARALRLLAGRADIAPNAISPALLPALSGREGLQVRSHAGANVTYLLLQNEHPPLDDSQVRRAVGRAIDRDLIVRTLLAGRAQIATTFFPPGSLAHPADLVAEPFDPSVARATLAEVGGGPLTLLVSTDRAALEVARAIAQQLADAGLLVELSPLDFGVMMHRLSTGDFDLATLQMPELTEPNLLRWFFHSSFIPSAEHPSGGANRARYRSHTVDAWLDQAASESRRDERALEYAKVARQLAQDAPAIPLWHQDQIAVVSPRASEYAPSAEGRWLSVAELR